MQYYANSQVNYLLFAQSNEKVVITYGNNKFSLPKIGPRPPYYTNPRYEPYFPII